MKYSYTINVFFKTQPNPKYANTQVSVNKKQVPFINIEQFQNSNNHQYKNKDSPAMKASVRIVCCIVI